MRLEVLKAEMIKAMKNGDKIRKDTLSMLIGNVNNLAIANMQKNNITEELVDTAILKEVKIVAEQIRTCPETRVELLNEYKAKLSILEEFAPKMMSADEIKDFILEVCATEGITLEVQNRGRIMRASLGRGLSSKADGKLVSDIVGELLK